MLDMTNAVRSVKFTGMTETEEGRVERFEVGGWNVSAKWDPSTGYSSGPIELLVTLVADASPQVRRRGLNTGALRRIEQHIAGLLKEGQKSQTTDEEFRAFIAERASELPDGPRSSKGDYYGQLLALFELIEATQPDPVADLALALQMPANTLKSQLNRARKARRAGSDGGTRSDQADRRAREARQRHEARSSGE